MTYPLECYFTGEDYDQETDAMIASFTERYTRETPGILKHPRWGDIPVMPFEWTQTEQFVRGVRVGRVTVEFRQIGISTFPVPAGVSEFETVAEIVTLADRIEELAALLDVTEAGPYASFSASVKSAVASIDNTLGAIASVDETIEEQFRTVQADINTALDLGASAVQILSQVGQLIRLPAQIVDDTITKVAGYAAMTEIVINGLLVDLGLATDRTVALNTGKLIEAIGSQATAGVSEAGLFSDFTTREASGQAIDYLALARELYLASLGQVTTDLSGAVEESFTPDHNTESQAQQIAAETFTILITRSFDLAAKQTIILTAPSDPLTLTFQFYGNVDLETQEFFNTTNRITGDEFFELSPGREIVAFV